MPDIRHKRGTRAALNALAGSNGLLPWQIYALTDEARIAIALTSSTYQTFLKEGEGGGGGSGYWEGPSAPNPVTYPFWFNTTAGAFLVYADGTWVEPGANFKVFVQGTQPADTGSPYLWVQTGLPNGGWTLWFNNDGTT